mmetsp:Transcript_112652/g.351212  ORF Transcript_112652/g.351212 Transcript_112652/m.351212 type:complete len:273 (-) Transcript_112652:7-825(-)
MALPAVLVIGGFLLAVATALALMAYLAWRGSKPSDFFLDAVQTTYDLQLPEAEIDAYYEIRDRLQRQHAPASAQAEATAVADGSGEGEEVVDMSWFQKVPPEERQVLQMALMRRLVCCIDRLDQVQRDKPGNWKLWRGKLVSERYWGSLCDAEKLVSDEIDACVAEAELLEPGWRQHIFPQALQFWRMQKQQDVDKKEHKKEVKNEKKEKEREEKRKVMEEKQKEEDKLKQERLAEKAMEKLLREEEKAASAKAKSKAKAKADAKQKPGKKK